MNTPEPARHAITSTAMKKCDFLTKVQYFQQLHFTTVNFYSQIYLIANMIFISMNCAAQHSMPMSSHGSTLRTLGTLHA